MPSMTSLVRRASFYGSPQTSLRRLLERKGIAPNASACKSSSPLPSLCCSRYVVCPLRHPLNVLFQASRGGQLARACQLCRKRNHEGGQHHESGIRPEAQYGPHHHRSCSHRCTLRPQRLHTREKRESITFAVFKASTRPFPLTAAQRTLAPPLKFNFRHTITNATLSTDPDGRNGNEPSNRTYSQDALCNTGRRTCKQAVPPPSPQIRPTPRILRRRRTRHPSCLRGIYRAIPHAPCHATCRDGLRSARPLRWILLLHVSLAKTSILHHRRRCRHCCALPSVGERTREGNDLYLSLWIGIPYDAASTFELWGRCCTFLLCKSESPAPPMAQSSFDLTVLRSSLPAPPTTSPGTFSPSPLFPDQAPGSSWATEFLTHTSDPQVAKLLQPAIAWQTPGYSTTGQLFRPSFSHSASRPAVSSKRHANVSSRSSPASRTHACDITYSQFRTYPSNNHPHGLSNRQCATRSTLSPNII